MASNLKIKVASTTRQANGLNATTSHDIWASNNIRSNQRGLSCYLPSSLNAQYFEFDNLSTARQLDTFGIADASRVRSNYTALNLWESSSSYYGLIERIGSKLKVFLDPEYGVTLDSDNGVSSWVSRNLPASATGNIQFSQSTSGSRFKLSRSDNKENLSKQTDIFGSDWTKSLVTVSTDGTEICPTSGAYAQKITETGSTTAERYIRSTGTSTAFSTIIGQAYVCEVDVKAGSLQYAYLLRSTGGFGALTYARINLSDGSTSVISGSGTFFSRSLGNGWYRFGWIQTATSSATANQTYLYMSSSSSSTSYTGTGSGYIYSGALQTRRVSTLDDYVSGESGIQISGGEYSENLCTWSQQIHRWSVSVGLTLSATLYDVGFSSGNLSQKIVETSSTGDHKVYLTTLSYPANSIVRCSARVKRDTGGTRNVWIEARRTALTNTNVNFDLDALTATVTSGSATNASVTHEGGGVYYLTFDTPVTTASTSNFYIGLSSGTSQSYTGSTSQGMYVGDVHVRSTLDAEYFQTLSLAKNINGDGRRSMYLDDIGAHMTSTATLADIIGADSAYIIAAYRIDATSGNNPVLSSTTLDAYAESNGRFSVINNDGAADTVQAPTPLHAREIHIGEWYHEGGYMYSGTNGSFSSSVASGSTTTMTATLRIGGTAAGTYFGGHLLGIVICNEALTTAERYAFRDYLTRRSRTKRIYQDTSFSSSSLVGLNSADYYAPGLTSSALRFAHLELTPDSSPSSTFISTVFLGEEFSFDSDPDNFTVSYDDMPYFIPSSGVGNGVSFKKKKLKTQYTFRLVEDSKLEEFEQTIGKYWDSQIFILETEEERLLGGNSIVWMTLDTKPQVTREATGYNTIALSFKEF